MSDHSEAVIPRAYIKSREHIYRVHVVHQCLRCGDRFDSEELLLSHVRGKERCPTRTLVPAFGVNQSNIIALKSKKAMRGRPNEEKWKDIYRILFPGQSHIPSPCESSYCPIQKQLY